MEVSVFEGFPDHVKVLAKPTEDGMFYIHVKVSGSEVKTYPNKADLREALAYLWILQKTLGLPDESVLMGANKAVVNTPHIDNRKLKKFLNHKGVKV